MVDLKQLREEFGFFDSDDNATIEFDEFVRLLRALSAYDSDEEARIGFDVIDMDKDGRIDFNEFQLWWNDR